MQLSGVLKRVAVKLSKTCNDLRLLSSGPRAGFGEINLPPMQAGSSIMPGKVNPVIPEVVNQVAFEVIGNDLTVTLRGRSRPAAAQRLRADHRAQPVQEREPPAPRLPDAGRALRRRHHRQPRALARARCKNSIGIVTALNPYIGYENAPRSRRKRTPPGGSVYSIVLERAC